MIIKEIRALTGLSQVKFGKLYDIPPHTIENWEMGTRRPPEYLLKLLERAVREDFEATGKQTEANSKQIQSKA